MRSLALSTSRPLTAAGGLDISEKTFSPLEVAGTGAVYRALYAHRPKTRNKRDILERVQFKRAGVRPHREMPDATVYLEPDRDYVGRTVADESGSETGELWIEPLASTATRSVDHMSTTSFRGRVPYAQGNRALVSESLLEARVAKVLQTNRRIVEIRDQWPRCEWYDADGVVHVETFDFWALFDDQQSVAVAVKQADRVIKSGILGRLKAIAAQGIGGYANKVALITDVYANQDNEYNAGWILRSRRMFNKKEYDGALARIHDVYGAVQFNTLLADAPSHAGRRTAIWNLIDEGLLVHEEKGRITDLSWLHRPVYG